MSRESTRSLGAVSWLYFFVADVQTGLGPFIAAYLAANAWKPHAVGFLLTFQGLVAVALQTPAGAIIDSTHKKRLLVGTALGVLAAGALLLCVRSGSVAVYCAAFLIGLAGPFLAPALAAITLGVARDSEFDRQFARNQGFNSAGNVGSALLVGLIGYALGYRYVFAASIVFCIPALVALSRIAPENIDYARARGSSSSRSDAAESLSRLLQDRVLVFFLACVFLFHLSNAAMLPQLGEFLSQGKTRAAAPFMSACIIVTQLVIAGTAVLAGRVAHSRGRRPLLLLGFGVLPIRGMLYTVTQIPALLIAIQVLDGVANCIFVVVSILLVKDRTEGSGRFNLAAGALATVQGIGAALSNALGGLLIQKWGFNASFAGLAAVGACAAILLWAKVPETLRGDSHSQPQVEALPLAAPAAEQP